MNSHGIVETFNVLKYARYCLPSCLIVMSVNQFLLQLTPEMPTFPKLASLTNSHFSDFAIEKVNTPSDD